jgi:hypothetical protein
MELNQFLELARIIKLPISLFSEGIRMMEQAIINSMHSEIPVQTIADQSFNSTCPLSVFIFPEGGV